MFRVTDIISKKDPQVRPLESHFKMYLQISFLPSKFTFKHLFNCLNTRLKYI